MELKPIPGTLGFLADSEGHIHAPDYTVRKTYRNGDGYITANVLTDDNEWVTFGVHRLVALAFHGLPVEGFDCVNHRDTDITNNKPGNLEWVSVEQNNIHAEIFRGDNHRPSILAINREYFAYPSWYLNVWEASEKTGISPYEIWDAIKCKNISIENERGDSWHFSFRNYSDNIPANLQKDRIKERGEDGRVPERKVKVRDIDSDVVMTFDSIATAAKHFGVGTSAIHQAIPQRDVVRVFKKKYQVAYEDQEFMQMSEEDWERAKNTGPRDVVAYNHVEDKFWFFESGVAYIAHSKLSKKAVTTALVKNRLRKIGDWTALYYEGENFRTLVEHVKGSSPGVIVSNF